MKLIKVTKLVCFDVDDTLCLWAPTQEQLAERGIPFKYLNSFDVVVEAKIVPHQVHIEHLKRHKMRGHTVFLWSAGSGEWAYEAGLALGLDEYVDYAMGKPDWIYDDKNAEDFMPDAQWQEDK